jgi:hypothetical protein
MFSVERNVGCLVEVRIADITTLQEVEAFVARIFEVLAAKPGRVVFCVDSLGMNVLDGEGFDKFVAALRKDNPRFIRSAILTSAKRATFALQVARMVREANNPHRRTFKDAAAVSTWLGEVLDPPEQARLATFLGDAMAIDATRAH